MTQETKNKTWSYNHIKIRDAFMEILSRKKRPPTYREISEKIGLSINTVQEHVRSLKLKSSSDKFKILTEDVLAAIAKGAMKGNVGSQKLWMQIVEGWRESEGENQIERNIIVNIPGESINQSKEGD